jgi:arylsulfatase A-like enzyme/Flp pilus assembly protein TadD
MWGACVGVAVLGVSGCGRPHVVRSAAGFNLLLVTLDTVRADHVGAWGYRAGETPNLDRLAAEGVRFGEAETPVPLTLPSHATILSGLLPPEHGLRNNGVGRFPAAPATLATDLAAAGYRTGAFIAAFVLDHRYGLNRGFATYDDDIPRDTAAGLDARRPGRVVVDRALAWLDEDATKPFFAWVHLYDAHAPYAPPEPFATRFATRPYDGGIAEVDTQLGRLLADLDRRGLAARTVVAVVGDHGEELGEHGELTHGLLLYEPSLHVPLIVRAPGVLPAGWTVRTPVSLVDLGPTLAGLLNRPLVAPAGRALDGRNLSLTLHRRREPAAVDLYAESMYGTSFGWSPVAAIRQGDLKYIAAPRPELYNLARDPHEATNLAANRPREARLLAAALTGMRTSTSPTASPADTLDAEARAKLLSLGYLAGASLPNPAPGHAGMDPKDAVVLLQQFDEAHAAFVAGKTDLARHEFEQLVAADPGNPVFVGQLAELYRRTGDLARAVALYRQAVALAPSDRDARYNLAVTLQEAGRGDEAFAALNDAIRLDPGRPEAHNALGIALALRGDLEGARSEFARTVELDPHDARAFNNLANVLRDLKRPDDAEAAYRSAIALAPNYADPLNGLGTLEVQRHHPAAAIPYFERALAAAPAMHEARLNLGIAEELAGDPHAAADAYREFLKETGGDREYARQRQAARNLLARVQQAKSSSQQR